MFRPRATVKTHVVVRDIGYGVFEEMYQTDSQADAMGWVMMAVKHKLATPEDKLHLIKYLGQGKWTVAGIAVQNYAVHITKQLELFL